MNQKNRKLPYGKLLLSFLCAGILSAASYAQTTAKGDYIYVEAKEWNKKHPELPKWKKYPSRTVDCLKNAPTPPGQDKQIRKLGRKASLQSYRIFLYRKVQQPLGTGRPGRIPSHRKRSCRDKTRERRNQQDLFQQKVQGRTRLD